MELRILPKNIADMIAAGEVVQRPSSVVKELMENAVDAGASEVQVAVTDAGRTLIQVIDNGCGMSADDAVLCFERHATSKIATAEDLESMETSMRIVKPTMGVWPEKAPNKVEKVSLRFVKGRCVAFNGKRLSPLETMKLANAVGGRNGIGMKHALENRIIGTKSRGVYEAPGMEMLGRALRYVYQAVLDRRATDLFEHLSHFLGNQIYDGRFFDLSSRAAWAAVDTFAALATGTVKLGLYKGNVLFQSLTGVKASLYFEENASMEDAHCSRLPC